MRLALATFLVAQACFANAKQLQFECVLPVTPSPMELENQKAMKKLGLEYPIVEKWEYSFLVDDKTLKGVERGKTAGGYPYTKEIEVTFTPERMQVRRFGDRDYSGWIDRRDLTISYGGASGTCKMTEIKKVPNKKF